MTQTLAPAPKSCTCGAANLASCLCGTTAHDWFAAEQAKPAKQTPVEKRIDFIQAVTKPVNDRALGMIAAKAVGQDVSDLTLEEFTAVAVAMSQGTHLGRTLRWKNACQWAVIEIGQADAKGQLDASFARWAVVQGSVWMAHAAD